MIRVGTEKENKKKTNWRTALAITAVVICIPVLFWTWYHTVTPQDRYFIKLEESDIKYIYIFNGRTGHSEKELTGNDRQEVVEQLLSVKLKGGWRTEGMDSRGEMYHIVLTDGREFDFGVTAFMEQESDGMFRSKPHYVIDGIRMYNVPQKDTELSERMKKLYVELMNQYYPD